jgi:hypothetical protein
MNMKNAIKLISMCALLASVTLVPAGYAQAEVVSAVTRGETANLEVEVDVVDSVSGERMGAEVRKGVGAKLASKDATLTLTDVQPLLDKWIDTGTSFLLESMK